MSDPSLTQPVGPLQPNNVEDVKAVQALLNKQTYATHITLTVDGHYGHNTERAHSGIPAQGACDQAAGRHHSCQWPCS